MNPPAEDPPPHMVVKWGIMGTANIAGKIVHTIGRAEGCEVVAVASRSLERYT